jgi:hypothetical protein
MLSDDPKGCMSIFGAFRGALTLSIDISYGRSGNTLEKALTYYMGRISSDPRDAIYALLPIIGPIDLEVSYDKLAAQVFTEATVAMVRESRRIDILSIIGDKSGLGSIPVVRTPSCLVGCRILRAYPAIKHTAYHSAARLMTPVDRYKI